MTTPPGLTPPTLTPEPTSLPAARPLGLRGGLRRLSGGLLVYGAIGLVLAVLGLVALLWIGGRLQGLAERTEAQVESMIATLDDTAQVLDDAGATALSFAVTLERTPPTVRQAAQTVGNLQANLRQLESQLASFTILGQSPLGDAAAAVGQMATDLEGLDTRLGLIATDLEGNRDALLANAASLDALGTRLAAVADDLRDGIIQDGLGDVQAVVTVLALVLVIWTALPAVGALGLGWWLRRELGD